jgi:long-chain acyl-CoA synthetase
MLSATKGTKPMQSWIHVIEWRATVRPDVPALIDDRGARYSYADLLAALERHAGGWAGLGVRPGDRVAVVAKNSADFLVHAFAILRAGATPAFINWRLSAGELAEVLALVEPAAIAADAEFAATELTRKVVIGVTDGGEDAIPAGWTDGRTLTGEVPPPEDR